MPLPADHLCQLAAKLVHLGGVVKYRVRKIGNSSTRENLKNTLKFTSFIPCIGLPANVAVITNKFLIKESTFITVSFLDVVFTCNSVFNKLIFNI